MPLVPAPLHEPLEGCCCAGLVLEPLPTVPPPTELEPDTLLPDTLLFVLLLTFVLTLEFRFELDAGGCW